GYDDPAVVAFRKRVTMKLDPEIDAAYPARWIGKVAVETRDGRVVEARVDEPKGDPGNTLSRAEIEAKVADLAAFSLAADEAEVGATLPRLWAIADANQIGRLMPAKEKQ
ncbi:hypothetical protein AB4144_41755, partial [Rhizobiaceae sp. 2RAB30]